MHTITDTEANQNLAKTIENVCNDHAPVIITGKQEHAVVMISLEDYNAMEETNYLLRSPKNAQRLLDAIAEVEAGRGKQQSIVDQLAMPNSADIEFEPPTLC